MSRTIDPKALASGKLTDEEKLYLQDRGQLPRDVEPVEVEVEPVDPNDPLKNVVNTGDANTAGITQEEHDFIMARRAEEETQPVFGDSGGIQEDEDDPYGVGWNNDSRMAELSGRGLSIEGKKSELIARLLRSDNDELTEDDYPVPTAT